MKKLLLLIIGLIGVLVIAALVAPYFISADTVKNTILTRIEAATGRHITVNGKFQLRFFPAVGVTMENVEVANPPAYGDTKPLAALQSLDVDVAVIPLFSGNIEVKKLILEQPQINLHVSKSGMKNWLPPEQKPAAAANPAAEPSSASSMPLPRNLMLNGVKMENGAIDYNNEASGQHWNIAKLNAALSLSGVSFPFTVDASGEWNGKNISVKGTLATLQAFLSQERTKVNADVESDLLSLKLDGDIEKSVYTGKAAVKSSSLKALMAWLNPSAAAIHAQGPLALDISSDAECAAKECSLSNASLSLDSINAHGGIKVNWDKKPQVDVNLTTGVLDLNPFLAQHADASGGLFPDAFAAEGPWSDAPIDLSALQAFNGSADIVADGIVANKITLGKTTLHAKLDNAHLSGNVVDAVIYGGKANVTFTADASGAVPTFEKHASLKGVQLQPLLEAAAGISKLSGAADIDMAVTGQGRSEREAIASLAGSGKFSVNNGVIEGVDLATIAFNKKSGGAEKTPITAMNGSFTIAQGIVSNKDLVMDMPTLHVSGAGDVNLPAYTISYRLTPQVTQAAGGGAAAKTGVALPVIVEGSLEKPSVRPDLNALAQQALKNPKQFKQELQNTRKNLENSFKGGLNNPNAAKNLKNLLQGL